MNDPILFSLVGIVTVTVLFIAVFAIWKPNFVLKGKERKLIWGKVIFLSLILGLLTGIMLFVLREGKGGEGEKRKIKRKPATHAY